MRPLQLTLKWLGILLVVLAVVATALWATFAIEFSNLPWPWLRRALAVCFAPAAVAMFVLMRPIRRALAAYACAFLVVLTWYYLIPASNDRDWQPDVARAPTVSMNGDLITVHNVRNFHYRSETDFDEHYEDRTYDRSKLAAVDLIMSYWGPRHICHSFVTFVFDDGQHLCISIETRKEKGEAYSAVRGLFRQFELIYIFGDERDLIGLRTNCRGEDVYVYRLRIGDRRLHEIFDDYLRVANQLASDPDWYNAITDSCSIGIVYRSWASQGHKPFRLKYLLNGHWDEYLYLDGSIFNELPFDQVRSMSRVNEHAKATTANQDFSTVIRAGLPAVERIEQE